MEILDPKSLAYKSKVAWIKTLKVGDKVSLFGGQQLQIKHIEHHMRALHPKFLQYVFNLTMFLPKLSPSWQWLYWLPQKLLSFLETTWDTLCYWRNYTEMLDCIIIDHQGLKHSALMCCQPIQIRVSSDDERLLDKTFNTMSKEECKNNIDLMSEFLLEEDVEVIRRWSKQK